MSWLKDGEVCNSGLCKAVDVRKEKGLSENAVCNEMSEESNGLYSGKQILDRYRYHTGKDKKVSEIPKEKATDDEILKHVHIHTTYPDMMNNLGAIEVRKARLGQELKEDYAKELKALHPEMDDEKISEMAERTYNAMHPECEKTRQLKAELGIGDDTIDGEIIEED